MRRLGLTLSAITSGLLSAALIAFSQPGYAQQQVGGASSELSSPLSGVDEGAPTLMQADEMIYDAARKLVTADGNVQIYHADYLLVADRVTYDQKQDRIKAYGNVRLREPSGSLIRADELELTGDFAAGVGSNLAMITPENIRLVARGMARQDGNIVTFNKAAYTACSAREGKAPIWQIKAAKVVHNQGEKTIEYHHSKFEFFGVPIAYFPYFSHPDPTVKRQSGFLAPSLGYSEQLGVGIEVPYYWALAPHYDVTLSPRLLSRQGLHLTGEFRHRLHSGSYKIVGSGIEQLDRDAFSQGGIGNRRRRGGVASDGEFELAPQWRFGWSGAMVSDDDYWDDYGISSATEIVSQAYVIGQSERNYAAARVMHFRDLVRRNDQEYLPIIHPVIDYSYIFDRDILGGELRLDANILSLSRDVGVDSERGIAAVSWRRSFTDRWGQRWTPFAQLRGDFYAIHNREVAITNAGDLAEDTIFRGVALVGLDYRYPFISSHRWGTQIIEPIAQIILRSNERNYDDVPNEDAQSLVFDDTLLFEWDKFSGYDRVEGGSRANIGIRYLLNLNSGGTARAIFGRSFHLGGDNSFDQPALTDPTSGLAEDASDYVGAIYLEPNKFFGLSSRFRLDSDSFAIKRHELSAWTRYKTAYASVTYTKVDNRDPIARVDNEEVYTYIQLPRYKDWQIFGSWRHDLTLGKDIQRTLGIRYLCDCLDASFTYQEDINRYDSNATPDRKFMLHLYLRTLGGFKN